MQVLLALRFYFWTKSCMNQTVLNAIKAFCHLDQKSLATLLQLFDKGNFAEQADGSSDGTDKPLADDTILELTVVADDSEETAADDNSVTLADDNVNGEIIGVLLEALSKSGQLDFDDIVKCKIKDAMPVWFDHNCLQVFNYT